MTNESPSPPVSATLLPFLSARSRRPSLASINSRNGEIDKDVLSRTLNNIHTSASRSDALTSFHDFDGGAPRSGPREFVSGSVSGLYNRLMSSVGVTSKAPASDVQDSHGKGPGLPPGTRTNTAHGRPLPSPTNVSSRTHSSRKSKRAASPVASSTNTPLESTQPKPPFSPNGGLYRGDTFQSHDPDLHQSSDDEPIHSAPLTTSLSFVTSENDRGSAAGQALAKLLSHHDTGASDRSLATPRTALHQLPDGATLDRIHHSTESLPISTLIDPDHKSEFPPLVPPTGQSLTTEERPPMRHVGVSHLPGFEPSRTPSASDLGDLVSLSSAGHSKRYGSRLDASPNLNSALQRKRSSNRVSQQTSLPVDVPNHLKRRVISKEFWMKDENARDCFSCGQAFSTFRRKHHCRTCGQIFDSKCTTLVPGRPFGQPGTLRLCRPCEAMVYGDDDDDSTIFTEDGGDDRSPAARGSLTVDTSFVSLENHAMLRTPIETHTPSIGIPVSRRNRESKRRSAIIEFDAQPSLGRPTSAHSLLSLSRRARSSSHRRHQSRFAIKGGRGFQEDRIPFHQDSTLPGQGIPTLPAFHHDNVIDPDLAPFMSDQGSDDDDEPSIMSTLEQGDSPSDRDRFSLNTFLSANARKTRSRAGDRTTVASSVAGVKEDDVAQLENRNGGRRRKRNDSIGSLLTNRHSTRLGRSEARPKSGRRQEDDSRRSSPHRSVQIAKPDILRSSAMRGSYAPPVELNAASLEHVKKILTQLLEDARVQPVDVWSKSLMPILLQCTADVEPDVPQGDDMDVRHYVKMKKIPGGRPGDTSYVSGVVFSKNVALKSMPTSLSYPRIAIVTFSIEYARHEPHFLSLEPVIAQEREYLRNLVNRIAALNPQLLLVQRNVSGLALELLNDVGITVAYNIKESVLAAVARVTQTPMIRSVDKLTIDPSHLGGCQSFNVKTYVDRGLRKTYIFLSGCLPELGCTIILRGSDTKTLRTVKRITEFMCHVVYNLKLETSLMRDEFVSIPLAGHDQLMPLDSQGKAQLEEDHKLNDAARLGNLDTPCKYGKIEEASRKRILSASPFVIFMQPYVLTQLRDQEIKLAKYKALRDQYAAADVTADSDVLDEKTPATDAAFELVRPEMIHIPASRDQPRAVREYLDAVHEAQLEKGVHTFETQKRLWDSFSSSNNDPFDPFSHQTIVVLSSTVSSITSAPCYGPELVGIGFYSSYSHVQEGYEEDCTLGQYIEDLCASANTICEGCGKKMCDHSRQYVHGYGQLSISIQRQASRLKGYADKILMWSSCRKCHQETAVSPMSENSWKYSFAKYLELSFWSSPLHPRANLCQHDIHKDFLRCFELANMIVKVQYDTIDIYDVVVPRSIITWKVEADLLVKNGQYTIFAARLNAFVDSVNKRLDSITLDALEEKKIMEAHDTLNNLRSRIKDDHQKLLNKLQQKYSCSRYYELIPLNRALRYMDEKAIEWDEAFTEFENNFFPSETDIRKLAVLQLKNMFLESQPAASNSGEGLEYEDGTEMKSVIKPLSSTEKEEKHDMPSEKAHDVMTSSIAEHREAEAQGNNIAEIIPGESIKPEDMDSSKSPSPREEHEQVVARDEVRHLDLAVAQITSDDSRGSNLSEVNDIATSNLDRPPLTDETFTIPPKPLSSGLLERIEQIRSKRTTEADAAESKIPRLADLQRRESTLVPPPLLRAQSHPIGSPIRPGAESGTEKGEQAIGSKPQVNEASSPIERKSVERSSVSRLVSKVGKVAPSLIPRSIPIRVHDETHHSSVSALAKHFEQLSREFENQRLRERRQRALRSRQARANPLASSRPVVEVYSNANDAVGDQRPDKHPEGSTRESINREETVDRPASPHSTTRTVDDNDQAPETSANEESQPAKEPSPVRPEQPSSDETGLERSDTVLQPGRPRRGSDPTSAVSPALMSPSLVNEIDISPELTIPDHKKNVWFKYLADFWSKRSASGWAALEYPLYGTEHVFEDSDIIVREDEPSSVIALSLACTDYQAKVKTFRSQAHKNAPRHGHSGSQSSSLVASFEDEQSAVEASLLSDTGTHMKYSFSHGQVKASCKIFYAEAFDALRRRCMIADRFVESLSRCLKYDSKGGKTKSLFLKTLDNRFIIKSLQEVELKAFNKFAPDYFAFMSYTLFHGVPSVIAKMFGLFQVTIKNPGTGMDFSYYLLVMENLFYERNPNRRFDLKGSMRNRKIESTGQPDEVLLDENLVETIFESPLFVREHARKLLQASVYNDTMWLCKQNVMDYSLMAGFDDERKELVVGIIDCIRTYTWDKKLESWIKDRGKNKPTITSPKDYRNRFRVSMMQYVLQAPNCWHQFQAQMVPPKTLRDREDREDGGEEIEGEKKLDVI